MRLNIHIPKLLCGGRACSGGEEKGGELEEYRTEAVFRAKHNSLATQGPSQAKQCSQSNPDDQPVCPLNTPAKSLSTFKPKLSKQYTNDI